MGSGGVGQAHVQHGLKKCNNWTCYTGSLVPGLGTRLLHWHMGCVQQVSYSAFVPPQGCVFGSLVISKSSLTFQPHTMDPLIRDRGSKEFEFVVILDDITYAALTKECYPPRKYDIYPEYCNMCIHRRCLFWPSKIILEPHFSVQIRNS